MNGVLLWIITIAITLNVILILVVLSKSSKRFDDPNKTLREELRFGREEANKVAKDLREEVSNNLKSANDILSTNFQNLDQMQRTQLESMTKQLKELQDGNERKLEEMRKIVDEKLHSTLEKRLGEAFKLVNNQLEAVQQGLGEMQNLATGVGDLKRVLTNVKARGTWAEVQLGALLDQILAPGQFERNVRVREDSGEIVEFAIKLPGPKDDPQKCIWLPIDSKFPQEDYLRIQGAAETGDQDAVQKATDALSRTIQLSAQKIRNKYIYPPNTTDFAIMFLATEGLYAEILRQPSLVEKLQSEFRVVVAGPTTISAILNSLRMGFQTLAIEQRAAEVWKVLSAVKTEFGKFGDVLNRLKRQLDTATRTIDDTGRRTRAIERKLRSVEQLPESESSGILQLQELEEDEEGKEIDSENEHEENG